MTEDEIVGWYHWLDEQEFGEAPRNAEGQSGMLQYMGLERVEYD